MRVLPAVALFGLALAACSSQPAQPAVTYQTYSYSCCQNGETTQVWHAGERRTIQWTVVPGAQTADARATPVVIRTQLVGPFATVTELKNAIGNSKPNAAPRKVDGTPLRINNHTSEGVISVIQLPADLPAGLYNLDLTTDYGNGNGARSASIIVVG